MILNENAYRQMPMLILACAAIVAVVTFFAQHMQTTDAARAIQSGAFSNLVDVINRHPEQLNKPDKENGFTPLHWAVMGNQTNMVKFLLAKGANVNARDPYGMTPLHKAAAFGCQEIAELLTAHGADLRAFGTKYGVIQVTPLHLAAESGFPGLVQLFLDAGVDVNIRTEGKNRVTPLHMAAAKGRAEVVEILLKSGAEVNARDIKNETPLHWALASDQKETADMLKIYGGTE